MKFECGDLERAFSNPDLMPEAVAHIKACEACRLEYKLWMDISSTARELHEEWESPNLWGRIRLELESEARRIRKPLWRNAALWAAVAAALVITVSPILISHRARQPFPPEAATTGADRDFLTEQALADVEKTETAYRKSIDHLAHLAEPKLADGTSLAAVNAREKLLMIDSAIADTRTSVASNRFNLHLQSTLAELYREKQQTLKELLTSDKAN